MSKLGIGTGITPDDGNGDSLLEGAVKVNSNFNEIYSYFGDGSDLTSGSWRKVTSGINTTLNVGIGTTNPRFALEVGAVGSSGTTLYVNGDARVTGILTVGSSSITLDGSSNTLKVGSGVTIYGNTGIISATDFYASGLQVGVLTASTIIYEGSVLQSYWSETSAGINTLSNVGIGTTNATSKLTVQGDISVSGVSTFQNDIKVAEYSYGTNSNQITLGNDKFRIYADGSNTYLKNYDTNSAGDLYIEADEVFIRKYNGTETIAQFTEGAGVKLNYQNINKLETLGIGVTVTGTTFTNQLNVSGVSTFSNRLDVDETIYLGTLGGNAEFRISRSGGVNIFESTNGAFNFSGDNVNVNESLSVIGDLNVTGISTLAGITTIQSTLFTNQLSVKGTSSSQNLSVAGVGTFGNRINLTSSSIYFNQPDTNIDNYYTGGKINLQSEYGATIRGAVGIAASFNPYQGVKLYHSNSQKFETIGSGVTVTGTTFTNDLIVSGVGTFGAINLDSTGISFVQPDTLISNNYSGGKIKMIAPSGVEVISQYGGDVIAYFANNPGQVGYVELYYNNSKKFETIGAGVTVTGTTFTNQLNVSGVSTHTGDINVGIDTSSGLVLTSPNGTQYRLIVDNSGNLSTTAV